ncbi:hypothetical protein SB2_28100 [Methylobacterium radiotolerans]|nr:hypothetical protein SB3_29455 [Methylobacterium radiotolerans]KTS43421.1 hypothetical protein SB2_28100 [Methylobacterium radiotolerans]
MGIALFTACVAGSVAILWCGGWRVLADGGSSESVRVFSIAAVFSALLAILGVFLLQRQL